MIIVWIFDCIKKDNENKLNYRYGMICLFVLTWVARVGTKWSSYMYRIYIFPIIVLIIIVLLFDCMEGIVNLLL